MRFVRIAIRILTTQDDHADEDEGQALDRASS